MTLPATLRPLLLALTLTLALTLALVATPLAAHADEDPSSSDLTISVAMDDAGAIPAGLSWTIVPSGAWTTVATGAVTAGGTSFSDVASGIPFGSYQLWITGGSYASGYGLVVSQEVQSFGITLTRLPAPPSPATEGELVVTVQMQDAGAIPAGLTLDLVPSGSWTPVASAPVPSGGSSATVTFPDIPLGDYQAWITGGGYSSGQGAAITQTTQTIGFTLVRLPAPPTPATEGDIHLTVRMLDGGALPAGLSWAIDPSGSWTPVASGTVTAGATSFSVDATELPVGVYQIWVTGGGYSSGRATVVAGGAQDEEMVLTRLSGSILATLTTSNHAAVPTGTTWTLSDAGGVVSSGALGSAMADGSVLTIGPVEFGLYRLRVEAAGFAPVEEEVRLDDAWNWSAAVSLALVADPVVAPALAPAPAKLPDTGTDRDAPLGAAAALLLLGALLLTVRARRGRMRDAA